MMLRMPNSQLFSPVQATVGMHIHSAPIATLSLLLFDRTHPRPYSSLAKNGEPNTPPRFPCLQTSTRVHSEEAPAKIETKGR